MKSIKVDLSKELTYVELIPLADFHIGDPACNKALIAEKINYIKENKNAYCILNGDIMNNATKQSISDVYSEQLKPMEQLEYACKLFEPIKDKIIGVTSGNHEFRTWKSDGIDLTRLLCRQLGIEDKYSEGALLIFLRFGEQNSHKNNRPCTYSIFVNHGSGGGRKEGSKIVRLADMASIVDADIYIHSHTHLPMIMKESFYRANLSHSNAELVPKLFVNTNAFLDYGGYGETFEFKPSSSDTPHIYLNGCKKQFSAEL